MEVSEDSLFQSVKEIIAQSREKVFRLANSTLLLTYWRIEQLIVENEQKGKDRAEYGKYTLKIDYYKYIYKIKSNTEIITIADYMLFTEFRNKNFI